MNGKMPIKKTIVEKIGAGGNKQNTTDVNYSKLDNEEIPKLNISTKDIAHQIHQSRTSKHWTRENLAQACSLPLSTIRDYETQKAIVNGNELVKIGKALGIVIKKPKN